MNEQWVGIGHISWHTISYMRICMHKWFIDSYMAIQYIIFNRNLFHVNYMASCNFNWNDVQRITNSFRFRTKIQLTGTKRSIMLLLLPIFVGIICWYFRLQRRFYFLLSFPSILDQFWSKIFSFNPTNGSWSKINEPWNKTHCKKHPDLILLSVSVVN